MRISKGLKQGYQLMDFAFDASMALRDSLHRNKGKLAIGREDATAIAALIKSWELTAERVRILRGKPLPGSLRPEQPKARKRSKPPPAAGVVSTAPGPPSEPEAAVKAGAPEKS
jgi:hypothetical protein